jgi:4-amino-4-deoxy-L-arabinose transferase-like glycosyltransferase
MPKMLGKESLENKKVMKIRQEVILLLVLIVFSVVMLFVLNHLAPNLLWDETVYLGNARSHISQSNFTEDFRYPLLEYLVAFVWVFTGESILAAKLLVILISTASVLVLYLISKRFFDWKTSLLLSFLFAASPLILFWGGKVYTDVPSMFFILLCFYLLLKSSEAGSPRKRVFWLALAALSIDLAFLLRFTAGLFALCVFIYLVFKKQAKSAIIFALFALIFLTPWLAYNQMHYQNPIWDLEEQFRVVGEWTSWEPISKQVANLFIYNNWAVLGLFFAGVFALFYAWLRKRSSANKKIPHDSYILVLIYVLLSFVYYLFFVKLKDARYYISFLPFIFILAFFGLDFLKKRFPERKKWAFMTILVLLIVLQVVFCTVLIKKSQEIYLCEVNHPIMQSIDYLKDMNPKAVLGNAWPWYGYHLNVKVASLWDPNITMLIGLYNASYIAYDDLNGIGFDKKLLDQNSRLILEKTFKGNCAETVYLYRVEES